MQFIDLILDYYYVGSTLFNGKQVEAFQTKDEKHEYKLFYKENEEFVALSEEEKGNFLLNFLPKTGVLYKENVSVSDFKYKQNEDNECQYDLSLKILSEESNKLFTRKRKKIHNLTFNRYFYLKNEDLDKQFLKITQDNLVSGIEHVLQFISSIGLKRKEFEAIKNKINKDLYVNICGGDNCSDSLFITGGEVLIDSKTINFYSQAFNYYLINLNTIAHEFTHFFSSTSKEKVGFRLDKKYIALNEMMTCYIADCVSGENDDDYDYEREIFKILFPDGTVPNEVLCNYFRNETQKALDYISKSISCPKNIIDELLLMCDFRMNIRDYNKLKSIFKIELQNCLIDYQKNLLSLGKKVKNLTFEDLRDYERKNSTGYNLLISAVFNKDPNIEYDLLTRVKCLFEETSNIDFKKLFNCLYLVNQHCTRTIEGYNEFCDILKDKKFDKSLLTYCAYVCPRLFFENIGRFEQDFKDICDVKELKQQIINEIIYNEKNNESKYYRKDFVKELNESALQKIHDFDNEFYKDIVKKLLILNVDENGCKVEKNLNVLNIFNVATGKEIKEILKEVTLNKGGKSINKLDVRVIDYITQNNLVRKKNLVSAALKSNLKQLKKESGKVGEEVKAKKGSEQTM